MWKHQKMCCVCVKWEKIFCISTAQPLTLSFHLYFVSLAISYAKFCLHPSCSVRCKYSTCLEKEHGDAMHKKQHLNWFCCRLSTVHFITFVVMRFVSFTNSHSQSRCSLRIQLSWQEEKWKRTEREKKAPSEHCEIIQEKNKSRETGAAKFLD